MQDRCRRDFWTLATLVLLALAAAGHAWSTGVVQDARFAAADAKEAAALAFSGHPEQAGALLTRLGRAEPAIFVRGCLALDQSGSLRGRTLTRFSRSEPDEIVLLRTLASR